tara:strand:- start:518 stop:847 length:330 start_codon:yes stop_codon:yes gene_type:complete
MLHSCIVTPLQAPAPPVSPTINVYVHALRSSPKTVTGLWQPSPSTSHMRRAAVAALLFMGMSCATLCRHAALLTHNALTHNALTHNALTVPHTNPELDEYTIFLSWGLI